MHKPKVYTQRTQILDDFKAFHQRYRNMVEKWSAEKLIKNAGKIYAETLVADYLIYVINYGPTDALYPNPVIHALENKPRLTFAEYRDMVEHGVFRGMVEDEYISESIEYAVADMRLDSSDEEEKEE